MSCKRQLEAPKPGGNVAKKVAVRGASTKMKVYVRVRPFNEKEEQSNCRNIVKILDECVMVFDPKEENQPFFFHGVKQRMRDITKKQNKEMQFFFNRVYGGECTNRDVYDGSIKDLLPFLLDGFNCSVFVYGATGAGKTFTMVGNDTSPGITYLTMLELYSQMEALAETKKFELRISYLEVYNENVHDLLNPGSGILHLREDSVNGVVVANMKLEHVQTADHLLELLRRGNENRTQHPTDANAESSRSHAVFQVFIKMQNRGSEEVKFVKLTMIDLAGSERGAATNFRGARFKEGSNINKSLLALGNCINNLADGVKHIPYRDSKLTRLLKDSLGGNCQTVMIACVGPTSMSYEDTYNTLKYATRAKNIKTMLSKNVMSIDTHVNQYKLLVQELRSQVEALKSELEECRNKNKTLESDKCRSLQPDLTEWIDKITAIYKEKKQIHEELLNLESKEKILSWKLKEKNFLHRKITLLGNDDEEGKNSQYVEKIENSKQQLNGRISGLRDKMFDIWDNKLENHNKIVQLQAEIDKNNLHEYLSITMLYEEQVIKNMELMIQQEHTHRLNTVLYMDRSKECDINADLINQIKQYHAILRATNKMTNGMVAEYNEIQNKMRSGWNVSWEVSPSNQIKKTSDELKQYASLSLAVLDSCLKPHWLKKNNDAGFKIPIYVDGGITSDEDAEEEQNTTFNIEKPEVKPPPKVISSFKVRTSVSKFKHTPKKNQLYKDKIKPLVNTAKGGVALPSLYNFQRTPSFKLPKKNRAVNKENM